MRPLKKKRGRVGDLQQLRVTRWDEDIQTSHLPSCLRIPGGEGGQPAHPRKKDIGGEAFGPEATACVGGKGGLMIWQLIRNHKGGPSWSQG